jgi:hypothetical protein
MASSFRANVFAPSATPMLDDTMDALRGGFVVRCGAGAAIEPEWWRARGPSVGGDEWGSRVGVGAVSGGRCLLPDGKVEGGA